MNEKIQNLIQELANELQNQEAGMSLSIINLDGNVAIAQSGNEALIGVGVLEQYERTKRVLQQSDCDCPGHRKLYERFGIEHEDSEFGEWYQGFLNFAKKMDHKKGGIKF